MTDVYWSGCSVLNPFSLVKFDRNLEVWSVFLMIINSTRTLIFMGEQRLLPVRQVSFSEQSHMLLWVAVVIASTRFRNLATGNLSLTTPLNSCRRKTDTSVQCYFPQGDSKACSWFHARLRLSVCWSCGILYWPHCPARWVRPAKWEASSIAGPHQHCWGASPYSSLHAELKSINYLT